ncbi:MAG: cytochrome C [Fluviibacter sp.]
MMTLALLSAASVVHGADKHQYGPYPTNYAEECGSCHVPYPPQRMTQAGWETQMHNLKQHYGSDASVDGATKQAILSYLLANASSKEKSAPTDATARMTKTRWFVKEHGTTPPKGQSFSNCAACHTQAEKGDFSERTLKAPAGWRHGD